MPLYKESPAAGVMYRRAYRVLIENPLSGSPLIAFLEESVLDVEGQVSRAPVGECQKAMLPGTETTEFPLLDHNGDPTGKTATYGDAYDMLVSLYYHVADERDSTKNEDQ